MQLQSMGQKLASELPKKESSADPKGTNLSSLPGQVPGKVLDQKTNVAEPACSGTLATTCGVPDTDPKYCDTLSGCPKPTDLSSLPGRTPGNILDQKTNVAEPACSGTLFTTCGVPDTDPKYCDTLSGCPKPTDLSSLPGRGPGGILDQKTNVAEPACSGTLMSTCGSPDTAPTAACGDTNTCCT
jgi:hypothetical protein